MTAKVSVTKQSLKIIKLILHSNKQSLLKRYGARMTKFSMNPYFIFKRFECYATQIVKELLYNKNQIFLLLFQKVL